MDNTKTWNPPIKYKAGKSKLLPSIEGLKKENKIMREALESIAAKDYDLDNLEVRETFDSLSGVVINDTKIARETLNSLGGSN